MEFRKADLSDLQGIMDIIRQAQDYMKANGIDQWQNGYPDEYTISDDINKGCSYVLTDNKTLAGTAAVLFDGEKTYDHIYNGEWITSGEYAAVHRVAMAGTYRNTGAAIYMMKCIEDLCRSKGIYSIKIDTHEDNLPMRKFLKKCNYQYCGIIYLEDGSKRLAYEKQLD